MWGNNVNGSITPNGVGLSTVRTVATTVTVNKQTYPAVVFYYPDRVMIHDRVFIHTTYIPRAYTPCNICTPS